MMNIENEFQKMITMAYGSQMLSRSQTSELRVAFIGGMMIGHRGTLQAATDGNEDGDLVLALCSNIIESFNKANNDR